MRRGAAQTQAARLIQHHVAPRAGKDHCPASCMFGFLALALRLGRIAGGAARHGLEEERALDQGDLSGRIDRRLGEAITVPVQ